MVIGSFKLRYRDRHVRVLPVGASTGIDLHGERADAIFDLAHSLPAWLSERDPTIEVRAIACDLTRARLVISYQAKEGFAAAKPVALKLMPPESDALIDLVRPFLDELGRQAEEVLSARVVTRP
jgi:hypothetical protein